RGSLGEGRARHQRQSGTGNERLHDATGGVGPVGISLSERRHLTHAESVSPMFSRHSTCGHHCPLPPHKFILRRRPPRVTPLLTSRGSGTGNYVCIGILANTPLCTCIGISIPTT